MKIVDTGVMNVGCATFIIQGTDNSKSPVAEDLEKVEPSYSAGGNIKQLSSL